MNADIEDQPDSSSEPQQAPHSCQPPQVDLPERGATWTCPECGRDWRLLDVADNPEMGGPGQRMYWAVEGDPPPPKFVAPDVPDVPDVPETGQPGFDPSPG